MSRDRSSTQVTEADLDDVAELAEALERAAQDPTVELYVLDHDDESGEKRVQFTVDGKLFDAWFQPSFLAQSGMLERLMIM